MEETAGTIHKSMLQCNNFFGGQSMSYAPRAMCFSRTGENARRL